MDSDELKQYRIDRLNAAVAYLASGNKTEFGRLLGYKDGAFIRQMVSGGRPISEKTVRQIEELPKMRGWFEDAGGEQVDDGTSLVRSGQVTDQGVSQPIHVPVLANAGSMGPGTDVHDDVVVGRLSLSPQWISSRLKLTTPQNLRFIHGYGDSMEPTFCDGDVLLIDTGINDVDIDGVYVLEANDRLYIKRVRQTLSGQFQVSSDNATVKTIDVLDGTHPVKVLGKVVWVWNGRKI